MKEAVSCVSSWKKLRGGEDNPGVMCGKEHQGTPQRGSLEIEEGVMVYARRPISIRHFRVHRRVIAFISRHFKMHFNSWHCGAGPKRVCKL